MEKNEFMSEIPFELKNIAKSYDIEIFRSKNCDKNQGAYGVAIELGEFDDKDIEKMAFWHEMGHALYSKIIKKGLEIDEVNNQPLSLLSKECEAWELGLNIAKKYGYEYEYGCKERIYALKCLLTYSENNKDLCDEMFCYLKNLK